MIQTSEFERAHAFYRDTLGLTPLAACGREDDARVAILDAGIATLEIANAAQVRMIDSVEAEGRPSDRIRVAFEVGDDVLRSADLVVAGAELEAEARETPWRSLNARLRDPDGLQLTLFEELNSLEERQQRDFFTTPDQH